MKRGHLQIAVVIAFLFCALLRVDAATINISIDGDSTQVPVQQVPKPGGSHVFIIGDVPDEPFTFETENGTIVLGGELDPDPSIVFGGVAIDAGAPSVFSMTFILPLAPAFPNPSFVFDSFSGSVTNVTGSAVTLTALPPPAGIPVDGDGVTEMQVFTLSDDGGATWKNVGLDNGPSATIPLARFASGLYGNFNQGPIPTIAGGPWTHMRADVNFMLSGGNDVFSFNGAKLLIPEPAAGVLLLLAAAMATCVTQRSPAGRNVR